MLNSSFQKKKKKNKSALVNYLLLRYISNESVGILIDNPVTGTRVSATNITVYILHFYRGPPRYTDTPQCSPNYDELFSLLTACADRGETQHPDRDNLSPISTSSIDHGRSSERFIRNERARSSFYP